LFALRGKHKSQNQQQPQPHHLGSVLRSEFAFPTGKLPIKIRGFNPMAKVVCRIQKLHSMQKIGKAGSHNFRKKSEANREHLKPQFKNEILIGTEDLVSDVKKRLDQAQKNANGEFRSNAVLAVEMILSASNEYFKDRKAVDKWVSKNLTWLKSQYGDNCVNAVLHLDEQTPHIHVFIVPLDKKNKLNCREFFGGREKMKLLQDQSFLAVKDLGIQRGEPKEFTGATHKKTREWRKEQLQMDAEKTSFQESIDKVPRITTNITGLVKAETADTYYKKTITEEVKKTYAPKLLYAVKKSSKLKSENEKLKKENLEVKDEIKETRKRNFDLQQEISEVTKEAFDEGYLKSQKEYKAQQDKIHSENQKKLYKDTGINNNKLKL
jgi:hypothetical protein